MADAHRSRRTLHHHLWLIVVACSCISPAVVATRTHANTSFIVGCLAWGLCFFLISRIHPKLNKTQTKLTREIVGHITHIAEQVGTPKFIILGRIVRDVVFGTNLRTSYIGEITHEPGDAKRKFDELRKSL